MDSQLFIYAPNVHMGGGLVLLNYLLAHLPAGRKVHAFLDARLCDSIALPEGLSATWVRATVVSRLAAEYRLHRLAEPADVVLCFHGLPPLLGNRGWVVVFLQNMLYVQPNLPVGLRLRTRLRLSYERFVARWRRRQVEAYVVQTPTMRERLIDWWQSLGDHSSPRVTVLPVADSSSVQGKEMVSARQFEDEQGWDFVYVADGEAHKNHDTLLLAWCRLAQQGLRPSLALTLGPKDAHVLVRVEALKQAFGLRVENLGYMPHAQVMDLYRRAGALIFPSQAESFGLPLVEASRLKLPILASELDYVRDVCVPVQTFDPSSAQSIARAVERFLVGSPPPLDIRSAPQFWSALLEQAAR